MVTATGGLGKTIGACAGVLPHDFAGRSSLGMWLNTLFLQSICIVFLRSFGFGMRRVPSKGLHGMVYKELQPSDQVFMFSRALNMVFKFVLSCLFTLVAIYLIGRYIFEIRVYITDRRNFRKKVKQSIKYGDGGYGGKEVPIKDRIFFSYPFMILGFGFFAVMFWMEIF